MDSIPLARSGGRVDRWWPPRKQHGSEVWGAEKGVTCITQKAYKGLKLSGGNGEVDEVIQ